MRDNNSRINAMNTEINSLKKTGTCEVVDKPASANIIFNIKKELNGKFRYKARMVVKGGKESIMRKHSHQ